MITEFRDTIDEIYWHIAAKGHNATDLHTGFNTKLNAKILRWYEKQDKHGERAMLKHIQAGGFWSHARAAAA